MMILHSHQQCWSENNNPLTITHDILLQTMALFLCKARSPWNIFIEKKKCIIQCPMGCCITRICCVHFSKKIIFGVKNWMVCLHSKLGPLGMTGKQAETQTQPPSLASKLDLQVWPFLIECWLWSCFEFTFEPDRKSSSCRLVTTHPKNMLTKIHMRKCLEASSCGPWASEKP